jgi:glycosyltransferase involved in cell wall biosynthesis
LTVFLIAAGPSRPVIRMTKSKIVHMTTVHSALDARIFHRECRSLARAGFHVTIIGPHPSDTVADQVHIKSIARERSRLARMTRTVWRVYCEALKEHADIYHFHDPELIPAGLLLRACGKQVIYDIHEDMPKDVHSKFYLPAWSRSWIAWIMKTLEDTACSHFSALVTVTPSIAERFRPLNGRTVIVHNYPYPTEITSAQISERWDARRNAVAYAGNISALRGIREMVFAMALLPEGLPAALELAGNEIPENVSAEELRQHPGWSRVVHHGILDRPGTFRLLHSVRAGLVIFHPEPNHLEAMPQKMFEYMGAGLPVIASDFPLWRRILGEIGCGLFVNPQDPRAIAQAIEYVLEHPREAEEMGRRGQEAMFERYNWDTQAETLVKLYSGLLDPLPAV